jgi:hypothetical protein
MYSDIVWNLQAASGRRRIQLLWISAQVMVLEDFLWVMEDAGDSKTRKGMSFLL